MVATIRALNAASPPPVEDEEAQDANLTGVVGSSSGGYAVNELPELSDEEGGPGEGSEGEEVVATTTDLHYPFSLCNSLIYK